MLGVVRLLPLLRPATFVTTAVEPRDDVAREHVAVFPVNHRDVARRAPALESLRLLIPL